MKQYYRILLVLASLGLFLASSASASSVLAPGRPGGTLSPGGTSGSATTTINGIATSTFTIAPGSGVTVTSSTGAGGVGVITIAGSGNGSSTSLFPGNGIVLSPSPITVSGTISLASPIIITGNGTSTISGAATTTSVINNFNNVQYVPQNYATAGCAGIPGPMNWNTCVYDIYLSMATIGGGTIMQTFDVLSTSTGWMGTLSFNVSGDQVSLDCTTNVILRYAGTSTNPMYSYLPANSNVALNFNFGNPVGHARTSENGDCDMRGQTNLVVAGGTNSVTSTGIYYGGTWVYTNAQLTASSSQVGLMGAVGVNVDYNVNGFGRNLWFGAQAYLDGFTGASSGGNGGGMLGDLLFVDIANNSGERWLIQGGSYTDPGNSNANNAVYLSNAGTASMFFNFNSLDDAGIVCGASDGLCDVSSNHIENPDSSQYGAYIPIQNPSSDRSTMINASNEEIANDASGVNSFQTIIKHGGQLVAVGEHIDNYGGGTITNFSDHSNDNGVESEIICQVQVQGGGLTNIVAGGGNITYSLATGSGCITDNANSYPIEMYANVTNVNNINSGNNVVATFDHNGNWSFIQASSTAFIFGTTSGGQKVEFNDLNNWAARDNTAGLTELHGGGGIEFSTGNFPTDNIGFSMVSNATSGTFRIGNGSVASQSCLEMNDSVNTSTIEYIFTVSGVLSATTTKPAFCN